MHLALYTVISILLASAAPLTLADQCDTKEKAQATIARMEPAIANLREKKRARTKELEAATKAAMKQMVDSKRWTQAQSDKFFDGQAQSPPFQQEIKALNKRHMAALGAGMETGTRIEAHARKGEFPQACRLIKSLLDSMAAFAEVDEKILLYGLEMVKKANAK
ncbi:MAG: hypothetical protein V4857_02705 [Pseudomonadota bacterium]